MVTTPNLPPGRPIPDTDDLRLLAELVNNVSIPLANAAWNARMTQYEAATRLVDMAERGLPLRLVADGDRQVLWQITQAGPATSGVPVAAQQPPAAEPTPAVSVISGPTPGMEPGSVGVDRPVYAPTAYPSVVPQAIPAPAEVHPSPADPALAAPLPFDNTAPPSPTALPTPPAAYLGASPVPPALDYAAAPTPDPGTPTAAAPAMSTPTGFPPTGPPQLSAAWAVPPSAPAGRLPPAPAVPPHEQAIAGAVPLGQPPFGPSATVSAPTTQVPPADPPASTDEPARHAVTADPAASPAAEPAGSLWGVPGSSSWARTETDGAPAPADLPDLPAADAEAPGLTPAPDPNPAPDPATDGPGLQAAAPDPAAFSGFSQTIGGGADPSATPESLTSPADAAEPTQRWGLPERWAALPVAGPNGEALLVTLLDVIDPGDEILAGSGYRMEPGERAILVHCSVANTGQIPYPFVPDVYLVLETDTRTLLGKAAIAVESHPAFGVGVLPSRQGDGWSVFLVPSQTVIAAVKWCIRPDLPQTILSWPIEP